ncbi:MAG TPA: GAF domain-containing protein, partial [Mycobacteriales bacterium]|nr:GAF domain-containing protein [Mycobacteriales bacterium]
MSRATSALPAPRAARPRSAAPAAERAARVLLEVHAATGDEGGPRAPDDLCRVALSALLDDVGGDGTVWLTDPVDGATLQAAAVRIADAGALDELMHLTALHPPRLDDGARGCADAAPDGVLVLTDPWAGEGQVLPARLRRWLDAHPTAHALLLPLRYGDRVLGLLEVVRRRPGRRFTAADTAVARQVARHLATSLADAALHELERSTARRERVLAAVSRTVDEALRHPEELVRDVVRAVSEQLGAVVGIRLVGPWVDQLGPGAVHHPDPGTASALERFLLGERPGGFVDRCLGEGRRHVSAPAIGSLVAGSVGLDPDGLPLTAAYGVRLQARGEPLGVLVAGRPAGVFALEERRLVDVVVDRLSLALDNAALLAATRASARRHEAVVQHSTDMLMLVDAHGRTTWASASTLRRAALEIGRSVLGIVVPEDRPLVVEAFARVTASQGETTTTDVRVRMRDGRVRTVEVVANDLLADAAVRSIVLTVRDVTDEREAARALQLQARQQAVLAGIGSRALTATRLDDLFDHACHAVNDVLGTDSTGLLELMPEGDLLVRAGTLKSSGIGTTRIVPDAALAQVLSLSRTVVVEDYLDHPESWRRLAEPFGVRSGVVLPVVLEGRVWGLMSCHDTVPRRFSQVELDFLQTACTVLAGAVHRARQDRARRLEEVELHL